MFFVKCVLHNFLSKSYMYSGCKYLQRSTRKSKKKRSEEREQKIQFFWDFNSILVCLISHSIEIEFLKKADGCANKVHILGGV